MKVTIEDLEAFECCTLMLCWSYFRKGQHWITVARWSEEAELAVQEATTMECSVCLEVYGEGTRVTTLPCQHSFHADCIEPWLRLQGISATCPLCKRIVFPAAM